MIFIVFEDRDSYISYRSNPTWNNIYSLKDSGEIKSITSFVYLMPSSNPNSYFSKTVSKNLDSDHYFVSVPVFFVGINKEIIYRIGSQFFDDSISETHKVVIQRNIV